MRIFVFVGRDTWFGIKTTEFKKTLNLLGHHDLIFIVDETKTWYNTPEIYKRNYKQIEENITNNSIFMGSSMGGFGAILYASLFKQCQKVIAFAPQIHIDPKYTRNWDHRYISDVEHLETFLFGTIIDKFRTDIPYDIIYGSKKKVDHKHLNLIPKQPNIDINVIQDAPHNIPQYLKDNGILDLFVKNLLEKK